MRGKIGSSSTTGILVRFSGTPKLQAVGRRFPVKSAANHKVESFVPGSPIMKRLGIALLLASMFLAGCGDKKEEKKKEGGAAPAAPAAPAKDAPK